MQRSLLTLLLLCLAGCEVKRTDTVKTDLTIYVSGELLERGGVVVVYPLPVSEQRWKVASTQQVNTVPPPVDLTPIASDGARVTVSLQEPFYQVQFLYPEGRDHFTFRFRSLPGTQTPERELTTQLLTVGGVDSETGLGETMHEGFVGLSTSGTQIIHVNTTGINERAARVLAGIDEDMNRRTLTCQTQALVSACTFSKTDWPLVRQDWAKGRADLDKEYRRMDTLNKCYRNAESQGRTGGTCELKSAEEDEAVYEYRDAAP